MEEKLKEYHLKLEPSENPDAKPIEFSITDYGEVVCNVWGNTPNDIEVECSHPYQCIEWREQADDERGECKLCGATCDWHWEPDVCDMGDDGNGYVAYETQEREPDDWDEPINAGGIIGDYLKELQTR